MKTVLTTWSLRTYDVWGNAEEGYEVNDSFSASSVQVRLRINTYNSGTPHEFKGANLTDRQIQRIIGERCNIDTDGDDLTYYVNRARDGYPLAELHCESHTSLSPIRES